MTRMGTGSQKYLDITGKTIKVYIKQDCEGAAVIFLKSGVQGINVGGNTRLPKKEPAFHGGIECPSL
jgi:hypothetical protein